MAVAVPRVYREEGLQVPRRRRKKIKYVRQPMIAATASNHVWSMDFVWDRTGRGQPLKFLVVLDDFTKELLVLEPATSWGNLDVIRLLENAFVWHGKPQTIRSDNGAEFASTRFITWTHEQNINHFLIQPGRPTQNGVVESLNQNWFFNLADARQQAELFKKDYNTDREHSSLGRLTPAEIKAKIEQTLSRQVE